MNKRIAAIDALRGISIFMMVFCATISWASGLPAWMFHCQVPPPDFVFNPAVKGITWVDLVFPFFIFSMGAAMPFSLGGKLDKGKKPGFLKRFIVLALFAIVLGNAYRIGGYGWAQDLVRLGLWLGLFLALWRVPENGRIKGWAVNLCGLLVIAAMFLCGRFALGTEFDIRSIDIIIMILAHLALWGSIIWILTRKRLWARLLILLAICVLKELSWHFDFLDVLRIPKAIDFLFNWDYLQYLVICIVGMTVGDMLRLATKGEQALCPDACKWQPALSAGVCIVLIPLILWTLFTRRVWMALDICILAALIVMFVQRGQISVQNSIVRTGFALLALGIVFDPIDGGISKDFCNLSYMLTTSGLACLLLAFLIWAEAALSQKNKTLMPTISKVGQNPMIAYTLSNFIITPLFYLCGLGAVVDAASVGNPFIGLLRGLIITLTMVLVTWLFSKNKIYWRS